MPSTFPTALDNIVANKTNSTVSLDDHAPHHNTLADAVNAVESALGVNLNNVISLPQNAQSVAYTLVLSDSGKSVVHPITDNNARTFTIPANGTVAYPVGTAITFINMINTLTIAITTDTMYLAGAGTTGSRTLAAYGVATAIKVTSTSWIVSGNGLT